MLPVRDGMGLHPCRRIVDWVPAWKETVPPLREEADAAQAPYAQGAAGAAAAAPAAEEASRQSLVHWYVGFLVR